MGRKRDEFSWCHVQKLNGGFKCNYCTREFSGGATRIKSHLAGVKKQDIVICEAVPEDVRKEAQKEADQATEGTKKKLKCASTSSGAKESKITSNSISKTKKDKIVTQVFI